MNDRQWAFAYQGRDENMVNNLIDGFNQASKNLGMQFGGEPIWIEVPDSRTLEQDGCSRNDQRNGGDYNFCINSELSLDENKNWKNIAIVFVLLSRESDKKFIKKNLDAKGIAS